ncbi:hypothetical protein HK104_002018 [Borealophlyctis nickersoniae]|nr:hypothetical protein HK104_002018 [Borealophlyctis nickersoniae]
MLGEPSSSPSTLDDSNGLSDAKSSVVDTSSGNGDPSVIADGEDGDDRSTSPHSTSSAPASSKQSLRIVVPPPAPKSDTLPSPRIPFSHHKGRSSCVACLLRSEHLRAARERVQALKAKARKSHALEWKPVGSASARPSPRPIDSPGIFADAPPTPLRLEAKPRVDTGLNPSRRPRPASMMIFPKRAGEAAEGPAKRLALSNNSPLSGKSKQAWATSSVKPRPSYDRLAPNPKAQRPVSWHAGMIPQQRIPTKASRASAATVEAPITAVNAPKVLKGGQGAVAKAAEHAVVKQTVEDTEEETNVLDGVDEKPAAAETSPAETSATQATAEGSAEDSDVAVPKAASEVAVAEDVGSDDSADAAGNMNASEDNAGDNQEPAVAPEGEAEGLKDTPGPESEPHDDSPEGKDAVDDATKEPDMAAPEGDCLEDSGGAAGYEKPEVALLEETDGVVGEEKPEAATAEEVEGSQLLATVEEEGDVVSSAEKAEGDSAAVEGENEASETKAVDETETSEPVAETSPAEEGAVSVDTEAGQEASVIPSEAGTGEETKSEAAVEPEARPEDPKSEAAVEPEATPEDPDTNDQASAAAVSGTSQPDIDTTDTVSDIDTDTRSIRSFSERGSIYGADEEYGLIIAAESGVLEAEGESDVSPATAPAAISQERLAALSPARRISRPAPPPRRRRRQIDMLDLTGLAKIIDARLADLEKHHAAMMSKSFSVSSSTLDTSKQGYIAAAREIVDLARAIATSWRPIAKACTDATLSNHLLVSLAKVEALAGQMRAVTSMKANEVTDRDVDGQVATCARNVVGSTRRALEDLEAAQFRLMDEEQNKEGATVAAEAKEV